MSVEDEGRALVEQLGGRWSDRGGMCRCPAHDDRTPSLSVRPGRARLLLHCFAGCEPKEILRALEARDLLDPAGPSTDESSGHPPADRHGAAARRIWDEARSIDGTAAAQYLAGRGLRTNSPELRYHPKAPYGAAPLTSFGPALIAAVRDDSGLVAIHRTFLEPAQPRLATMPAPRRGLGRFGSGAVRLGATAPELGLAEGIETAMSASAIFGVPCWATLGAERFGLVELPAEVRKLLLFLDHDRGGRRAERLAREAFPKAEIEPLYPPTAGDDWNDVLLSHCRE